MVAATLFACARLLYGFALSTKTEGFRIFAHSTLQPVVKIVAAELSRVLEIEIVIDLAPLNAADVQGRARAFRALGRQRHRQTRHRG